MKKEVKLILLVVLSILILNLKVEAATGTGICYGEPLIASGYCKLKQSVMIPSKRFSHTPLLFNDSSYDVKYGFSGIIDGVPHEMFCIDSNLSAPGQTPYWYARPFQLGHYEYDMAMAKVYSMYVNDSAWLANVSGIKFEEAAQDYIQITNIVMRALTIKYNYDLRDAGVKDNVFDNVYSQFEGKNVSNPKLIEGTDSYKLAQRYYCSAILTCNDCSAVNDAINYCQSLPNISTSKIIEYKYTFSAIPEDIESIGTNPDRFEQIIPVKIKGLENLMIMYDAYKNTNPRFFITDIQCDNKNLDCNPVDLNLYSKNLVLDNPGSEYIIYVKVSGDSADFMNEANAKILIKYKSNHILDTNNLAYLRYSITEQYKQRMIALMPEREQLGDAVITIKTPTMCEVKKEGNDYRYYYGGVPQNELQYLQKGCCNVEADNLKNDRAVEYYLETCATEDIVVLETKCDNDPDSDPYDMSTSYVIQQPIDKIITIVRNAENQYNNNVGYTLSDKEQHLSATNNNRDDSYLYNASETDNTVIDVENDYCKMYTSENLTIKYPGTTEATSGRFFVFREGEQPSVHGKIYGNFHTDYTRWENDYLDAIEAEKEAYTDWQTALAVENAIENLSDCTEDGECDCCCDDGEPSTPGGPNTCGRETCCTSDYSGTNTEKPDEKTYFKANGADLYSTVTATRTCSCDSGTAGKVTTNTVTKGDSTSLETIYDEKVTAREKLYKFKEDCEIKSDVSNNWKYYLEPDLQFTYKQQYYNTQTKYSSLVDRVVETRETIDLEVSTKAEKYWPLISTDAEVISDSEKSINPFDPSNPSKSITIKYGGGEYKDGVTEHFDTTTDYQIGYEQTLYYIPKVKYYSLLPNGNYITNITEYQSGTFLDIGYVFNVQLTNYKNRYWTWFTIKNTGHLMQEPTINPKLTSNVQNSINKKLETIDDPDLRAIYTDEHMDQLLFNSICYYDDDEILYERACEPCPDDDPNPDFRANYFYRTVANDNLFPNEGAQGRVTGSNWTTPKGKTARENIEALGNEIYNDATQDYLDYSFILTPVRMQDLKEFNKSTDYNDFNLTCNQYGKECESDLLEDLARQSRTDDLLYRTRSSGWLYYIQEGRTYRFVRGSIQHLLPGGYPELDIDVGSLP